MADVSSKGGGGGCNYYYYYYYYYCYYSLPFSSRARFSEKGAVAEDKGIPCSGYVIAHCLKNFLAYRIYSEFS